MLFFPAGCILTCLGYNNIFHSVPVTYALVATSREPALNRNTMRLSRGRRALPLGYSQADLTMGADELTGKTEGRRCSARRSPITCLHRGDTIRIGER